MPLDARDAWGDPRDQSARRSLRKRRPSSRRSAPHDTVMPTSRAILHPPRHPPRHHRDARSPLADRLRNSSARAFRRLAIPGGRVSASGRFRASRRVSSGGRFSASGRGGRREIGRLRFGQSLAIEPYHIEFAFEERWGREVRRGESNPNHARLQSASRGQRALAVQFAIDVQSNAAVGLFPRHGDRVPLAVIDTAA